MNSIKRLLALVLVLGTWAFLPGSPAQATVCPTVGTLSTPVNLAADGTNNMDESSGVVNSGDYPNFIWDEEDSGNPNKIYAHNINTGNLKAVVTLSGVTNVDWEDIAIRRNTGTDQILVFNTGDNNHNRTNSSLVAFNEPDPANGNVTITPTVYPFTFTDSGGHQVFPNVEAGVIDAAGGTGNVFFFAKERDSVYETGGGGSATDFSFFNGGTYGNLSTTANVATFVGDISGVSANDWNNNNVRTGPVAADISSDRNYLILKNYNSALIWPRNGGWINTLTTTPNSPCPDIATGSGKYEGVGFSAGVDELYQVRDDVGNGNSPLKEQTFTP